MPTPNKKGPIPLAVLQRERAKCMSPIIVRDLESVLFYDVYKRHGDEVVRALNDKIMKSNAEFLAKNKQEDLHAYFAQYCDDLSACQLYSEDDETSATRTERILHNVQLFPMHNIYNK